MLKLNSFLIGSEDPKALAAYYGQVLQSEPGWTGGDFVGYDAGGCYLMIGPHDKVHGKNANPERFIYNLETPDIASEFERIKAIAGSTVVQPPYSPGENTDMQLATFADPDGNYFQLATPMKM